MVLGCLQSAYAETMTVSAKVRASGIRVMFYCQQPVSFSPSLSGTTVQVSFDRSFEGSLGSIISSPITGAHYGASGKSIVMNLAPGTYKIHKFVSDNFVGIDIIQTGNASLPASLPEQTIPAPKPKPEPVIEKKLPPAPKVVPVVKPKPKPKPVPVKIKPAPKVPVVKPVVKKFTPTKAEKDKTVTKVPTPVVKKKPLTAPPPKAKPVVEVKQESKQDEEEIDDAPKLEPIPPSEKVATLDSIEAKQKEEAAKAAKSPVANISIPPVKSDEMPIGFMKTEHGQAISFPWKKDVAAASFNRAGTLWIVFDRPMKMPTEFIAASLPGIINAAEQLPSTKYTILRLKGNSLDNIKVTRKYTTWTVEILSAGQPKQRPAKLITQYRSPYAKGVFFPAEKIAAPLRVMDPDLEDELAIFPFYEAGYGVDSQRQFVDFTLLRSGQGLTVAILSDNVQAQRIAPGIEIITPLANNAKATVAKALPNDVAATGQAFPFQAWQGDEEKPFLDKQSALYHRVLETDHGRKSEQTLALAQFYFAQGLDAEAWGLLKLLRQTDPPFMRTRAAKMLTGAVAFKMNRYSEAKAELDSIPPQNLTEYQKQELKLWQTTTNIAEKTPGLQLDYVSNKEIVKAYPTALKQQFAIIALENNIQNNNLIGAENLLNHLLSAKPEGVFKNDLIYYKGVITARKGDNDGAIKLWEPLTKDIDDRHNRARASFSKIKTQLSDQKITAPQAIEQLNALRNTWRGDDLEKEILKTLGDQYVINKQYAEALRAWKRVVTIFSNSEDSLLYTAKMTRLFIYAFSNSKADEISDMDAAALYYEFRDITPIGRMGDLVIQQLAYRLIKLDLLDRAAALLTHQVKYRLKDKERLEFGTKLAVIHLLNKKPQLALDALDATEENAIPEDARERLYLRVKALIALKQSDKALKLIAKDTSPEADKIRLDIYWDTSDWAKIESALAPVYNDREQDKTPLSLSDCNDILRLAVSYIMLGHQPAMTKLYEAYKDKLPKNSPLNDTFKFLATDKGPVNYKDLDMSLGIASTQSFVDKYKQLIDKESMALSKTPDAAPTTPTIPAEPKKPEVVKTPEAKATP